MVGNSEALILLDVHSEGKIREIWIDGTILIPDDEIKERASIELPNNDVLIIVYI